MNARDRYAFEELKSNLMLYFLNDTRIFDQLSRIFRQHQNRSKDLKKHEAMLAELRNVDSSMLARA